MNLYMLFGDKKQTAEHAASVVGISKDKVISEVIPDEKNRYVSQLKNDLKVVAMVGDVINDALASADVDVAMGVGVGAASEVSSIVLMGNGLSQLLYALELSRLTMKTVRQNLWWAFAYNINRYYQLDIHLLLSQWMMEINPMLLAHGFYRYDYDDGDVGGGSGVALLPLWGSQLLLEYCFL